LKEPILLQLSVEPDQSNMLLPIVHLIKRCRL